MLAWCALIFCVSVTVKWSPLRCNIAIFCVKVPLNSSQLTNLQGEYLYVAQLMLLSPTVTCFNKIQIVFIFLLLAHLGSLTQRAIKWVF